MMQWDNKQLLLAIVVSGAASLFYYLSTPKLTIGSPGFDRPERDHHWYITMATTPSNCHSAPECYRPIAPLITGALPFDIQTNFLVVTTLAFTITGILTYLVIRELGYHHQYAIIGVLLFYTLDPALRFHMIDFWLPDPLMYAAIAGITLGIIRDEYHVLLALFAIGVAIRENTLLLIPLYYTYHATKLIDKRILTRTIGLCIAPVIVFLSLRYIITTTPSASADYTLTDSLLYYIPYRGSQLFTDPLWLISQYTIEPFAALILLPLLNLEAAFDAVHRWGILFPVAAAQSLLGGDIQRYMMVAFPAMIVFALPGIVSFSQTIGARIPGRYPPAYVLAPPLIVIILLNGLVNVPFYQWGVGFKPIAMIITGYVFGVMTIAHATGKVAF